MFQRRSDVKTTLYERRNGVGCIIHDQPYKHMYEGTKSISKGELYLKVLYTGNKTEQVLNKCWVIWKCFFKLLAVYQLLVHNSYSQQMYYHFFIWLRHSNDTNNLVKLLYNVHYQWQLRRFDQVNANHISMTTILILNLMDLEIETFLIASQ